MPCSGLPARPVVASGYDELSHLTDHELKTAFIDELAWAPSANADRIGVSVDARAVILSGQVETYPEKGEAVHAVKRVPGGWLRRRLGLRLITGVRSR
jgi:hypothetical protein